MSPAARVSSWGRRVELSIIIPAFNEAELLPRCLASLPRDSDVEVIVVDNNSTDQTGLIAAEAGVRVVFEAVNHIGGARNAGARIAAGDWLLFLDADCSMNRALYRELRKLMSDARTVGAGSVVQMPGLPLWARGVLALWTMLSIGLRWAAGALILCREQAFREIGGFSDTLHAAEEIDLSRRLKRWGRARGQRFTILRRHPLETSSRKLSLYRRSEIMAQVLRVILHPRRAIRDKAMLGLWYDGRR